MMSGRSSKYPFTASQWQELEHQALIFKYMASGTPIPHDLLLPIKRSFCFDSCSTSPYPNGGWGCFQMGFGRKAEDPEPWRCRRTDGKKWRCSKEAYPDSKYCERHMHRGKNRSRKPVEMPIPTTNSTVAAATTFPTPSLYSPLLSMASAAEGHHVMDPYSASRNVATLGFPIHSSANHFNIDTASSAYRHSSHGLTEEVLDQYTTGMSASSSSGRERSRQFTALGMTSRAGGERRHGGFPSLQDQGSGFFPGVELQEEQKQEKRQHCFMLGAHMETEKPAAVAEGEGESRRPLLHFIDDWPLRASREPWMDAAGEEQPGWGAFAKTQLSISIPMAHHDLPTAGSRSGRAGD
ncbi:hypothetical protein Taro_034120 [Colocasia esculenta]|uniref:Growth-regulating factor n=1 Tax=Colocasia esculenta TaxID=4460 RepID=A0A843W911_COLES|nr:hypothetical protein [Colocasia esculenta]